MTRPAADHMNRDPSSPVVRAGQVDEHPRHPLSVRVGLLVTAIFVVLDQATKELAEALLEPGRFVPLLGPNIGWQLVYNPGGAFGFPAPSWVFLIVTVLVVVIVARALPRATTLLSSVAYGLLLAGALGNVLDRLFRPGDPDGWPFGDGYVVDFVAWGTFPRFNLADSAITVGFVLLVIALWREERALAVRSGSDPGAASDTAGAGEATSRDRADGADGELAAHERADGEPAAREPGDGRAADERAGERAAGERAADERAGERAADERAADERAGERAADQRDDDRGDDDRGVGQ